MIAFKHLNLALEQMHTHISRDTPQTIAVTRLKAYLERINHAVGYLPVSMEEAARIKASGRISKERLLKLEPENLRIPCIQILDNNQPYLIDGHHRYIYAYVAGRYRLPAYQVKPIIWRQYLVKNIPMEKRP